MKLSPKLLKDATNLLSDYYKCANKLYESTQSSKSKLAIKDNPNINFPKVAKEDNSFFNELVRYTPSFVTDNDNKEVAIAFKLDKDPYESLTDRFSVIYGGSEGVLLEEKSVIEYSLNYPTKVAIVLSNGKSDSIIFSLDDLLVYLMYDNLELMVSVSTNTVCYLSKDRKYDRLGAVGLLYIRWSRCGCA